MIDTLFTDMGDVIFSFDRKGFDRAIVQETGFTPKQLGWDKSTAFPLAQRGRISGAKWLVMRGEELGVDPQFLIDLWPELTRSNEPYFEFLRRWKASGKRIFLLSNVNIVSWRHHYRDAAIFAEPRLFDGFFLSYQLRVMKPGKRIFEKCLERAAVSPQRVLFVDDLPLNIETAGRLGICSWLYRADSHALFEDFVSLIPRE